MSTSPNTQKLNNLLSTFPIHLLHLSADSHPFIQETSIHYSSPTPWCTTNTEYPSLTLPPFSLGQQGGVVVVGWREWGGVRGHSSDRGQQEMAVVPGTQVLTSAPLHFSFLSLSVHALAPRPCGPASEPHFYSFTSALTRSSCSRSHNTDLNLKNLNLLKLKPLFLNLNLKVGQWNLVYCKALPSEYLVSLVNADVSLLSFTLTKIKSYQEIKWLYFTNQEPPSNTQHALFTL